MNRIRIRVCQPLHLSHADRIQIRIAKEDNPGYATAGNFTRMLLYKTPATGEIIMIIGGMIWK